jgi:uncharacterized protein with PIN domain
VSLAFYFDENVQGAIAEGLRRRGIDVLCAQEDGFGQTDDALVLDRADEFGRIMFTRDDDFMREATRRLLGGLSFTTVIYAHQLRVSIGQCIDDLELFAIATNESETRDRVYYLPLR